MTEITTEQKLLVACDWLEEHPVFLPSDFDVIVTTYTNSSDRTLASRLPHWKAKSIGWFYFRAEQISALANFLGIPFDYGFIRLLRGSLINGEGFEYHPDPMACVCRGKPIVN